MMIIVFDVDFDLDRHEHLHGKCALNSKKK